jgi:hypothetical protein
VQFVKQEVAFRRRAEGLLEGANQRPAGDAGFAGQFGRRRQRRGLLDHRHRTANDGLAVDLRPAQAPPDRRDGRQAGPRRAGEFEPGQPMGPRSRRHSLEGGEDRADEAAQLRQRGAGRGDPRAAARAAGRHVGAVGQGDGAPGVGMVADVDAEVGPLRNGEQRLLVEPHAVDDVPSGVAQGHEEERSGVRVDAVAQIAPALRRHLEHHAAEIEDPQRPVRHLDRVADEPQARAADGLSPGVKIIEGNHGHDATVGGTAGATAARRGAGGAGTVSTSSRRRRW